MTIERENRSNGLCLWGLGSYEKSAVNIGRFWIISHMWGKHPWADWPLNFLVVYIPDVITCFKLGDNRFRGLAPSDGQILPLPIDFDGRPYNTLTLPCERVIGVTTLTFQGHVTSSVT